MLDAKDPSEKRVITFDYTKVGLTPVTAVITCSVYEGGVDAGAAAMVSGAYQVTGGKVKQLYINGLDGLDYSVKCKAAFADGQELVLADVLPVRTLPVK